ncbi:MAG: alpha/beta family hydrolase [Candidatus Binataceae bacterium]
MQGTRDSFGRPDEVAAYHWSKQVRFKWIEDGDHSFKPRASGEARRSRAHQGSPKAARASELARMDSVPHFIVSSPPASDGFAMVRHSARQLNHSSPPCCFDLESGWRQIAITLRYREVPASVRAKRLCFFSMTTP